jgi:ABC-type polysaccharide/polyol phosphate transport system ATPase subunit
MDAKSVDLAAAGVRVENAKMAELRDSARAMFLVSHGLGSIKEMCSEAIWLDRGKLMMRGEPADVVKAYIKFVKVKKSESATEDM